MGVFGPCYIDGVPSGGQIWVAEGSAKQGIRRVNHGQDRRGGLVVLNCAIHIAAVTPRSATPAARARATSTAGSPKARRAKKPSTGRANRGSGLPTLPPPGLLERRPATAHRRTAAEPPPANVAKPRARPQRVSRLTRSSALAGHVSSASSNWAASPCGSADPVHIISAQRA